MAIKSFSAGLELQTQMEIFCSTFWSEGQNNLSWCMASLILIMKVDAYNEEFGCILRFNNNIIMLCLRFADGIFSCSDLVL